MNVNLDDATDINVLIVGTGEYTTGWVGDGATASDKKCGVVGLVMFDLRRRKKVGQRIVLCGTNGSKFPRIRQHLKAAIEDVYQEISSGCETVPADDVKRDPLAYLKALETFKPGDVAFVFTPDDTHFEIVMACIEKGLHVMVTKPIVKSLNQHQQIVAAAKKHNVLVCVEVHKRFDPVYSDARARIARLGDFGFFSSYMSQPKFQLETFKAWAGRSSDISYYLNSHHVDFHCWAMQHVAVPTKVVAMASKGVAKELIGVDCEDTITLQVQWRNLASNNAGSAIYTASWAASKADVHSQQRFFYLGHNGEVLVDQAHRGYTIAADATGFASLNPLYFRYTPDHLGRFVGQSGYGYVSIEAFIDAVTAIRRKTALPEDFNSTLPTCATTMMCTAILEAGRLSLDREGSAVHISCDANDVPVALSDSP